MRVLTEAGLGAPGVSVAELLSQPAQRVQGLGLGLLKTMESHINFPFPAAALRNSAKI